MTMARDVTSQRKQRKKQFCNRSFGNWTVRFYFRSTRPRSFRWRAHAFYFIFQFCIIHRIFQYRLFFDYLDFIFQFIFPHFPTVFGVFLFEFSQFFPQFFAHLLSAFTLFFCFLVIFRRFFCHFSNFLDFFLKAKNFPVFFSVVISSTTSLFWWELPLPFCSFIWGRSGFDNLYF